MQGLLKVFCKFWTGPLTKFYFNIRWIISMKRAFEWWAFSNLGLGFQWTLHLSQGLQTGSMNPLGKSFLGSSLRQPYQWRTAEIAEIAEINCNISRKRSQKSEETVPLISGQNLYPAPPPPNAAKAISNIDWILKDNHKYFLLYIYIKQLRTSNIPYIYTVR